MIGAGYPVQFSVDYPDRSLDRLRTVFRIVIVIPIAIVLSTLAGTMWQSAATRAPRSWPRAPDSCSWAHC